MLIKTLKIIHRYDRGFNDELSNISVEIYDVDRNVKLLEGDYVREQMSAVIKGIKLGINIAGYQVEILPIEEYDEVTGLTRKVK